MLNHTRHGLQNRKIVMEETKTGNNIFEYLLLYLITICWYLNMLIPSNVNYSLFPIPYSLIYSYSLNIINLN